MVPGDSTRGRKGARLERVLAEVARLERGLAEGARCERGRADGARLERGLADGMDVGAQGRRVWMDGPRVSGARVWLGGLGRRGAVAPGLHDVEFV